MRTLLAEPCPPYSAAADSSGRPRLGLVGMDGMGRHRMEVMAQSGAGDLVGITGCAPELTEEMARSQPHLPVLESLNDLFEVGVDGVVIATPGTMGVQQALLALERGVAVFCQKQPGRTADETRRVIDTARASNCLIAVDLPCRFLTACRHIHELCHRGELGEIYAVDLTFQSPHGRDNSSSGCVQDLGIHLVDFALRSLDFPGVASITARLFSGGAPVEDCHHAGEDYATARIDLENGATINLACSRKLAACRKLVISGSFHGTKGGALFSNTGGSLFHFMAEHFHGTHREILSASQESWDGRAAAAWAQQLADGRTFDPEIQSLCQTAAVLDAIYSNSETALTAGTI